MECPNCHSGNPPDAKFCGECGHRFDLTCSECGTNNPAGNKFCNECGSNLKTLKTIPERITETKSLPASPTKEIITEDTPAITGERKHVTVLFSDLTGYTTMSEKLDPEEVKGITSRIFGEISKIVVKYDGFIEKYAGDAVLAIFGVPKAHEDDPVRAVKAAREIHERVEAISPEVESTIGQPLVMHTGINTGLVVTGDVDMERGTHGIAGDTINLASRLSNLAKPGEILVNVETCSQIEGHFTCEYSETTTVKGKSETVQVHKVLAQREKPVTIRRLSGVRADLVGRQVELTELSEAAENLLAGRGRIFSIYGDAGTGKSRLVEEFKATLDLEEIQWIEGHAYAYAQNIPYFPLIDLLNRIFHIDEGDSSEKVRIKLEAGIQQLISDNKDMLPYLGGLYSLDYQEFEEVSPEFWKIRLQETVQAILVALGKRAPTVFFLEDLHWADPSFVELLRRACLEMRQPAIVLCVYRPTFSLFNSHQLNNIGKLYHEIRLKDLSLSDTQQMLESLLKTDAIPSDLKRLVQSKAEGNPFYLEELVNTLIDSATLIRDDGSWKLTRPVTESDISSSLHGLISGRLDRLETETRRILQEASVIGRAFLYEILTKITELEEHIEHGLSNLERLDLIRTRSLQPDLEYMFKHALTQEVVYNGLLKKERQQIHEQIARVMESLFQDRLSEFYETLAFHFARGQSVTKAVDYLVKSGEKSLVRYAVEEAHQYFTRAFEILSSKKNKSEEEKILLIDTLNKWGYVYYFLGDFREFIDLFHSHIDLAESIEDRGRRGMFYAWLGIALYLAGKPKESYDILKEAMELGKSSGNQKVVGYACTWLTWACADMCRFDEGIGYGEKAQKIAASFPADQYLFFKSLGALSAIYFWKGDAQRVFEGAKALLDYGERNANSRSKVFGHWMNGSGYSVTGDMKLYQKSCDKSLEAALDPFYSQFPKAFLGYAYLFDSKLKEAEKILRAVIDFCEKRDIGVILNAAYLYLAPVLIATGRMRRGLKMLEETRQTLIRNQERTWIVQSELLMGMVYSQIATGPTPTFTIMAKNIGFLFKNVPFAAKKAEDHLKQAIELSKDLGLKNFNAMGYLQLGMLYKAKKRADQARECISESIHIFEECEAEVYLKQAREAFESLS